MQCAGSGADAAMREHTPQCVESGAGALRGHLGTQSAVMQQAQQQQGQQHVAGTEQLGPLAEVSTKYKYSRSPRGHVDHALVHKVGQAVHDGALLACRAGTRGLWHGYVAVGSAAPNNSGGGGQEGWRGLRESALLSLTRPKWMGRKRWRSGWASPLRREAGATSFKLRAPHPPPFGVPVEVNMLKGLPCSAPDFQWPPVASHMALNCSSRDVDRLCSHMGKPGQLIIECC